MYTEEELLEAVDILVEDYGFEEDEAILMLENEILSELKRSTWEAAIAERERRTAQAEEKYDKASEEWLKKGDEKSREAKHKALDDAIRSRSKGRKFKSLYKHRFADELRQERHDKRVAEMKEEAEKESQEREKRNKEAEEQRMKEYEEAGEKNKQMQRADDNVDRYKEELSGGRERAHERYIAELRAEQKRRRGNTLKAGGALAVGGGYLAYKAYKKHKAKEGLKNRRNKK